MPVTYNKIASVTVGAGGASSIEFTSIPSTTYTDLVIKASTDNDAASVAGGIYVEFNGSTSNLSSRYLFGTGSAAGSATDNTVIFGYTSGTVTASTFGSLEIYIPNYSGSSNKSVSMDSVFENNATEGRQALTAGLWSNTAAITSIKLRTVNNSTSAAANFVQHSTATLYGIKKD
jgi:hypothetical protein